MNFKTRLIGEERELKEKIENLYDFTQSEKFEAIVEFQKIMQLVQLEAMRTYWRCLVARINELGVKPVCTDSCTMLKDWFTESDDGEGGKIIMAECPSCGDAVIWDDGCIACDAVFDFREGAIYKSIRGNTLVDQTTKKDADSETPKRAERP